jgi:signal transduction histidine kinase
VPAATPSPSTRELLGGRWAISLRGWLIGSVLAAAASAFILRALLDASPRDLAWSIMLMWIASSAILLCANVTVFRHRRRSPVAIGWVLGLALLLGVSRVATLYGFELIRPGASLTITELLSLFVAIVPNTAIAWLLITYLLASGDWYATERDRLMRFEIDTEGARLRALGALDATRAVLTLRIRKDLESQLAVLDDTAMIDQSQLSDVVLGAASEYVRPESHALWPDNRTASQSRSLRGLERASLTAPLPLLIPYALWFAVVTPLSIVRRSLVDTLLGAAVLLLSTLVLFPLGRRAIRRFAPAPHAIRARLLTLAVIVLAISPTVLLNIAAPNAATSSTAPLAPMSAVIFVTLVVIVSWLQASQRVQDERLRDLRSHAEEAKFQRLSLEAATEQMQRDLALYLHSTVQAGLVASAYAIQDAAARGDKVAFEHAIDEARAAAARVDAQAPAAAELDLPAMRVAIDETWQGLLAISWILPEGALASTVVDRLGNVVRECLANASIHGAATEATVRIVAESDCVIVKVTDNGSGLGEGKPGLGSAVLNEATRGQWTIATVPNGGAQVRAVVPN